MKSFQQFITESRGSTGKRLSGSGKDSDLSDREGLGHGTGMTHRTQTGKIGSERKKSELTTQLKQHKGQKKRVKAVGGGKTVEVSGYKKRKDVGKQRPRSSREQQPTGERGSAKLSPREQQKKARAERLAGKSSGKSKEELEKAATKLLTKKKEKKVDPKYKPQKASGYTAHERRKIRRAGERLVRDIKKGKEKHISHYDPKV